MDSRSSVMKLPSNISDKDNCCNGEIKGTTRTRRRNQRVYIDYKSKELFDENHCVKEVEMEGKKTKIWTCKICKKNFKYQYTLLRHMPIHSDVRNYKCDVCPKAFRQLSTLSQHKATHINARPHVCSVCQKSFNRISTLISHRKTHLEVKGFVCCTCGRGFHQKGNLSSHILTHTNERPFKCDICFKGFNQKSNLNCHKAAVHGEKRPFKCELCPVSFARENSFWKHCSKVHKLNTKKTDEDQNIMTSFAVHDIKKPFQCELCSVSFTRENLFWEHFTAVHQQKTGNPLGEKADRKISIPAFPNKHPLQNITNIPQGSKVIPPPGVANNDCINCDLDTNSIEIRQNGAAWSMIIRRKPSPLMSAVYNSGKVPFVLLDENNLPKICKANMGLSNFILTRATRADLACGMPDSNIKVPISLTVILKNDGNNRFSAKLIEHKEIMEMVFFMENKKPAVIKSALNNKVQSQMSSANGCSGIQQLNENANPLSQSKDTPGSPFMTADDFLRSLFTSPMRNGYLQSTPNERNNSLQPGTNEMMNSLIEGNPNLFGSSMDPWCWPFIKNEPVEVIEQQDSFVNSQNEFGTFEEAINNMESNYLNSLVGNDSSQVQNSLSEAQGQTAIYVNENAAAFSNFSNHNERDYFKRYDYDSDYLLGDGHIKTENISETDSNADFEINDHFH